MGLVVLIPRERLVHDLLGAHGYEARFEEAQGDPAPALAIEGALGMPGHRHMPVGQHAHLWQVLLTRRPRV